MRPIEVQRSHLARRVLTMLFALACLLACIEGRGYESTQELILMAFVIELPAFLWFTTEPEDPPELMRPSPHGRLRRALTAPFVPGGGRGALLLLIHAGIAASFFGVSRALLLTIEAPEFPRTGFWNDDDPIQVLVVIAYTFIGVLLPSGLVSFWRRGALSRPLGFFGSILVFAAAPMLQPGARGWVYPKVRGDGVIPDGYGVEFAWVFGLAGLALLINLPRMTRGLRSVVGPGARPQVHGSSGSEQLSAAR